MGFPLLKKRRHTFLAGLGNALVGDGHGGLHENRTVAVVGACNHAEQVLALGDGIG